MPEFIADTDGTVDGLTWDDLDPFTQGYIECILFTNTSPGISMVDWNSPETQERVDEGTADGSLPGDTGFGDFHPDDIRRAIADCARFQTDNAATLAQAYGMPERTRRGPVDYTAKRAGNDFWYDRVGHGTGFQDRDLGDLGETLNAAAEAFGNLDPYFGDPDPLSPTGYGFAYIG